MKPYPSLSVITLTKNRAEFLDSHLHSLLGQCKPSDEIIIIDNASTDITAQVIDTYRTRLPIRSLYTRIRGYSALYNFALKHARNPLVVFFDDDCLAHPDFLNNHRKAHADNVNRVVMGKSISIPKGNVYADMMSDHYHNWFTTYMMQNNTLRTFDNKNVSIPKKLLESHGAFTTSLQKGGDDIELGFRFHQDGVPIIYAPQCIAYHHERTTFSAFIAQHLRFSRSDTILARHRHENISLAAFVWFKIRMHTKTAIRREFSYIRNCRIRNAITLPFLYIVLFFLRIWGYATAR